MLGTLLGGQCYDVLVANASLYARIQVRAAKDVLKNMQGVMTSTAQRASRIRRVGLGWIWMNNLDCPGLLQT